jgi:cytochrome c oxidase subunit 2
MLRYGFFWIFLTVINLSFSDYTLNMTRGVTPMSQSVYDLHMLIFWICVGIGLGVFSVMFYAIIFHRKSLGHQAAHFHESTAIELIWTIIPFLILVAMAVPATRVLIKMDDTRDSDLTIKITGYMWRWGYDYLDENISFISSLKTPYLQIKNRDIKNINYLHEVDNPLVVPIHKKIRFLTTSNDVIHSWWVPALGFKRDAVPGFINEAWAIIETPGTYRGQCAELCGANHGFMPIVVIAKTESEYQEWLVAQKMAQTPESKPESKPDSQSELKPELKPE